jgi:hypothetical protein
VVSIIQSRGGKGGGILGTAADVVDGEDVGCACALFGVC